MLGQIMEWFYTDLAGIASDPAAPGFKRIIIRPQPVGDVTWAKAAYNSVHGRTASEWKIADGKFILNLEIPANTTATVYLPASRLEDITESGITIKKSLGIKFLRLENGSTAFEVGSGKYQFSAPFNAR